MGYLESAVVIYLRRLYYPHGFDFPLVPITPDIGMIEFLREAATIIMLLSIAIIGGRNLAQRFALFIYSFAVWDIFYYAFLKVFDHWPSSLFTWDILFIIPFPWVGPVIAPVIVSATMIVLTLIIIFAAEKEQHVKISLLQWALLVAGAFIQIIAFTRDYVQYVSAHGHSIWTPANDVELFYDIARYVPQSFAWWIFWIGELFLVLAIASIFRHIRRTLPSKIRQLQSQLEKIS
jgi:hypothetical protein